MEIYKVVKVILGIPKTIYYNLKMFGIKRGISMPLLVSYDTKIKGAKSGKIILPINAKSAIMTIGIYNGSDELGRGNKTTIILEDDSKWIIGGRVRIAAGSNIRVAKKAVLEIGNEFRGNSGLHIVCNKHICLGENVLTSWNVTMLDSDGHHIFSDDKKINEDKEIIVGSNVWVGANVMVLKGAVIQDDSVLGANSIITKKINTSNVVVVSNENEIKIVKQSIQWKI